MTAEFPSLASVIATHRWTRTLANPKHVSCTAPGCDFVGDLKAAAAEGKTSADLIGEHVERVWLEARTIRDAGQLDGLPQHTLLIYPYESRAGWKLHEQWERRADDWYCLAAPLIPPSGHAGVPSLPAVLIHYPEWVQS